MLVYKKINGPFIGYMYYILCYSIVKKESKKENSNVATGVNCGVASFLNWSKFEM